MADSSPQPTVGSLSAVIIRACPEHVQCKLDCPHRRREDLGEIASFDHRPLLDKIKERIRDVTGS